MLRLNKCCFLPHSFFILSDISYGYLNVMQIAALIKTMRRPPQPNDIGAIWALSTSKEESFTWCKSNKAEVYLYETLSACRGSARSKFGYLQPRKQSRVALSKETAIRAGGDACNHTEVEAQQFEEIDGHQKFLQEALSNVASDWTREDDDITDFVTAPPATIVAGAVADLIFWADGAFIEEGSESFDDVNSGCDDDSRS